jgi:cysteine desulfurase
MIYLDANATTPLRDSAKCALSEAMLMGGNPSSPHGAGRVIRQHLDNARKSVAKALDGNEKDIIFTSGATEGNRWLIESLTLVARKKGRPLKIATTPLEHPSVAKPLQNGIELGDFVVTEIPVNLEGNWDLDAVHWSDMDVVQTTLAHNETGLLPPVAAIEERLSAETLWAVDASQSFARIGPPPQRADVVVVSGHKAGAPSGCGAVLIRSAGKGLPAPWLGGGQENGLRPGTEAWLLHLSFGAVCQEMDQIRIENQLLTGLREQVETVLTQAWPTADVLFAGQPRLPNTSAVVLNGVNGEALRMAVDVSGVCVGFGAACSALAPEPSPALIALGLSSQQARATLRISLPTQLDPEMLKLALQQLSAVGKRLLQR